MKYSALIFLITLFFAIVSAPNLARSQSLQNLGGDTGSITVQTIPEKPQPGDSVEASVESYATDLDRAEISWYLNDTLAQQATGKKKFSFKVGAVGSVTNILVLIKTSEGTLVQKTITFRPASLDLIWEAESYTPPFYKGKALYPYQGTVKIVAIPNFVTENGGILSEKNLVYNWSVDDKAVPNQSGYGKNFIYVNGSIPLKSTNVSVDVTSMDQSIAGSNSTTITPQSPGILLYEINPLYGLLTNQAMSRLINLQNEEIKLSATPYFFSLKNQSLPNFSYDWQLDGKTIGTGKRIVSFKPEKGAVGNANVTIDLKNPNKIFQFTSSAFSLLFGNSVSNSAVTF